MPKLRVHAFSLSLDGYGAGPNQDIDNPLGVGGRALHEWAFATRTFRRLFDADGGSTGIDDEFAARGFANIGTWILGRNMFGPVRGPWPDDSGKGWWGDNPPYHTPVFVLTQYPRASLAMSGGTTFHFVTDGIEAALKRAIEAAGDRDVRLGRRGRHHPAISPCRPDRRDALGDCAGAARQRGTSTRRHRRGGARLSLRRTRAHAERDPCGDRKAQTVSTSYSRLRRAA